MSQCVPTWDLDEIPNPLAPLVPMLGGEVAEFPWEKDQSPSSSKPPVSATAKPSAYGGGKDVVPCLDHRQAAATGDALVPCAAAAPGQRIGTCGEGSSARVGSCSGPNTRGKRALKRAKVARVPVARVPVAHVCSSCCDDDGGSDSESESGRDSWRLSRGSSEWELGSRGFASSSIGSPESTCSDEWSTEATTCDDRDTAYKVSMLDEVIEHLKQLQAQVVMMSRTMNMSYMMLPMALQQHLQLSLMTSMGMGMRMGSGMGMGVMDINAATGFPNITTQESLLFLTLPPTCH
ncbi:basic helix-loop-helix (bHLH) DNA-binding superfamily protein [Actinidia rufa]|uniref:Basic helix-loop-helix (BHLH) DNA-binding superfamily protein n=1 Tax=Actinidia rufa TaxID=165716 RepID=A0A7J0DHR4_9ERIC|nr:basic helix-loop-helix (bHLH) DNA-binding superfamily protein [Actinidia rufa]